MLSRQRARSGSAKTTSPQHSEHVRSSMKHRSVSACRMRQLRKRIVFAMQLATRRPERSLAEQNSGHFGNSRSTPASPTSTRRLLSANGAEPSSCTSSATASGLATH